MTNDALDLLSELYPARWALALIAVKPRSKTPLRNDWNGEAAERWRNGADRDAHIERAAAWLNHGGNVGLALPVGVVALDADNPEARAWLDAALPDSPMQETANGAHFLVRVPTDAEIRATVGVEIAAGIRIDVRVGGKSQVVAAPSVHPSGQVYAWRRELPETADGLPECPALILEKISAAPEPETKADSGAQSSIPAGQRNAALARLAGRLRRDGLSADAIAAALQEINVERCHPPLEVSEVAAIARSIGRYPTAEASPATPTPRKSQADLLLELAARTLEVWRDPAGLPYATVPVAGVRANVALRGRALAAWLRRAFHAKTGRAPTRDAIQGALGVLEGEALYGKAEHVTHLRVARAGGCVYVDLGDPTWRAVEIDARCWRIVQGDAVPVKFRRGGGMQALPEPERGGDLEELRELAPLGEDADDAYVLSVGWMVAALRPGGPYPVLHIVAEQGSGKTTLARVQRRLIDPHAAELRQAIREPRDLAVAAENAHVVAVDNLSSLPTWTSDAICCLATGGGFATRELYADRTETIFAAVRPVILTGIAEVATRGDLLDRAVTVSLPRLREPRPEAELWERFETARPRLLGALLDAVAAAVAHEPATSGPSDVRMLDAARWVAAAERGDAVPWSAGEHADALRRSRASGHQVAVEASAIGPALLALLDATGAWAGTASDLLAVLEARLGERARRPQGWPRRARDVGAELGRLAPALRALGVEVERERDSNRGRARIIRLRRQSQGTNLPPQRPQRPNAGVAADTADAADAGSDSGLPPGGDPAAEPDFDLEEGLL
jgi:hypothetical protein